MTTNETCVAGCVVCGATLIDGVNSDFCSLACEQEHAFSEAHAEVKAASDALLALASEEEADRVYAAAIRYVRAIDAAQKAAEPGGQPS